MEVRDQGTSALETKDFEVVQTLSELNLTAAALPFPHRSCRWQPSKSGGCVGALFMGKAIAARQWHSGRHVHLYTGFTQSLSFIPSTPNANAQGRNLQTSDILDAVLGPTCRSASFE